MHFVHNPSWTHRLLNISIWPPTFFFVHHWESVTVYLCVYQRHVSSMQRGIFLCRCSTEPHIYIFTLQVSLYVLLVRLFNLHLISVSTPFSIDLLSWCTYLRCTMYSVHCTLYIVHISVINDFFFGWSALIFSENFSFKFQQQTRIFPEPAVVIVWKRPGFLSHQLLCRVLSAKVRARAPPSLHHHPRATCRLLLIAAALSFRRWMDLFVLLDGRLHLQTYYLVGRRCAGGGGLSLMSPSMSSGATSTTALPASVPRGQLCRLR